MTMGDDVLVVVHVVWHPPANCVPTDMPSPPRQCTAGVWPLVQTTLRIRTKVVNCTRQSQDDPGAA